MIKVGQFHMDWVSFMWAGLFWWVSFIFLAYFVRFCRFSEQKTEITICDAPLAVLEELIEE